MSEPKAWIGDLSAYNAGTLRGEWVDMTDADALNEAIRVMSRDGQSDYFVADYDEVPRWGTDWLGEYPSVDAMLKVAAIVDAASDEPIVAAYVAGIGESYTLDTYDADKIVDLARDAHYATGDSLRDVVMEYAFEFYADELHAFSYPHPLAYVDWDAYARDLQNDYTFVSVDGTVYMFSAAR